MNNKFKIGDLVLWKAPEDHEEGFSNQYDVGIIVKTKNWVTGGSRTAYVQWIYCPEDSEWCDNEFFASPNVIVVPK